MNRFVSSVLLFLLSSTVFAHNGEHGHLLQWLGHMLTSSDHLFGLLGLTVFVGVVAGLRHLRRRHNRMTEH